MAKISKALGNAIFAKTLTDAIANAHDSAKGKALKHKGGLTKVHTSTENCRHCGTQTSKSVRYEGKHREYDHDRGSKLSEVEHH